MKLDEALALPDGPERTTAIVAWVQGLFDQEAQVPIVVGGAAVEILTGGAYTTGDLDFVGSVPTSIGAVFESNGFEKAGRHWIHREVSGRARIQTMRSSRSGPTAALNKETDEDA